MSKIEDKKFAVVRNFGKSDEFFKFFDTEANAMEDLKKIADSYLNNPINWLNDKSFSVRVGGNSIDIWEIRKINNEKTFDMYQKEFVYIVMKNADFTEGRGPMYIHKIFRNIENAREYIKKQAGIFGSPQCCYHDICDENCEIWNGYDIKIMKFED